MPDDIETQELAVTENYAAWISHEPDGEVVYHLELGAVTVHLFQEEWQEVIALVRQAARQSGTQG